MSLLFFRSKSSLILVFYFFSPFFHQFFTFNQLKKKEAQLPLSFYASSIGLLVSLGL